MAPHSSTLAWKIPGMGEPGGLQSMGLQRVGDTTERLSSSSSSTFIQWNNIQPLKVMCIRMEK